jgi:hypothetical protein
MKEVIENKELIEGLFNRAKEINELEYEFAKDFRKEIFNKAETLPDDKFFLAVDILREEIQKRLSKNPTTRQVMEAVKDGANEFARKCIVDSVEKFVSFISFAKTYRIKVDKLYKPCFDNITGVSDDSYGDFCDRLPMAGKEVYEKAINGEVKGDGYELHRFNGCSECYFVGCLERAVERFRGSFLNSCLEEILKNELSTETDKKGEPTNFSKF